VSETRIVSPIPSASSHAHRGRRPDEPLRAHARFGEPEVQRLIGLARELAIDRDQLPWPRDLARDDDLVLPHPGLDCELGGLQRGDHHALVEDLLRGPPERAVGVLLHLRDDELLVQRAAVDPDPHRLAVLDRDPADGGELLVARRPVPTLPG